jgi:sarcosine oxidase subunit beta
MSITDARGTCGSPARPRRSRSSGTWSTHSGAQGLDLVFLPDNAAVRAVAPALSNRVLAASYCATDGHADPVKATNAFAQSARRHGATIREGVRALAIQIVNDRVAGVLTAAGSIPAERVIVAAGVDTPALLAPLGLHLPLSMQVVSVVQSEPLPPTLDQVFGVAKRLRGRQEVAAACVSPTAAHGRRLGPSACERRRASWSASRTCSDRRRAKVLAHMDGLVDLTPDALPVIDAPGSPGSSWPPASSGHGFCLGPVSGLLCADLAIGGAASRLAAFQLPASKRGPLAATSPVAR